MLSKWAEKSEKEKLEKINAQKMAELKEKQKIEEHRKSVFDLIDKYKLENSSTKDVEEVKHAVGCGLAHDASLFCRQSRHVRLPPSLKTG